MPTITLNKEVLLKRIGKDLSDDELKHNITFLGTDIDSIDGNEITVEVFPNRPDLLSEQGFSRALCSFLGLKTGLAEFDVKDSGEEMIVDESVKDYRAYATCAIVKGIKLDNEKIIELVNIQEKLGLTFGRNRKKLALGAYPLEKIKFPVYYKTLPAKNVKFKPLGIPKEMTAKEIFEEHPKGREYGKLIEGHEKYTVFMDSDDKIMSWTPLTNSHEMGKITEKTTDMFVESSGHDLNTQMYAVNMFCAACAEMGGEVYSMKIKYPDQELVSPNFEPTELEVDLDYINKRLGLELSQKEFEELLGKMGFGYNGKVLVPSYRPDVLHQIDIAEDIAIAYGYDNFEEEIPNVSTIGGESFLGTLKSKVIEILIGHGLLEIQNFYLSNDKVQNDLMKTNFNLIQLSNSLSQEYNCMRMWVIPCLLKTLSQNTHREYPQNLFEAGTIFKLSKQTDTGVDEAERVAIALCSEDSNYTKVKQILDSVLDALELDYSYEETEHPSFASGRVARVSVNKKGVAYVGEINPEVLANFGLEMPVTVFELNLTDLEKLIKK